mmetsp:Transcript_28216/g.41734  ORF Transcript_28216/g.41734 Transcript_28216/m.41734 type:complete len:149 (-) Transcript_28216:526-972(-)
MECLVLDVMPTYCGSTASTPSHRKNRMGKVESQLFCGGSPRKLWTKKAVLLFLDRMDKDHTPQEEVEEEIAIVVAIGGEMMIDITEVIVEETVLMVEVDNEMMMNTVAPMTVIEKTIIHKSIIPMSCASFNCSPNMLMIHCFVNFRYL